MNPPIRPTAADIMSSRAKASRREGNADSAAYAPGAQRASAPTRTSSYDGSGQPAPSVTGARSIQTLHQEVIGSGAVRTIFGTATRLVEQAQMRAALKKTRKEITTGIAEVHALEWKARLDAVRDSVVHNYTLRKAEHAEQRAVASQLLDERLMRLFEHGENRLIEKCANRLLELNDKFESGEIDQDDFDMRVERTCRLYAGNEDRLLSRITAARASADALIRGDRPNPMPADA